MQPNKIPIYQRQQIRELERLAQDQFGITERVMMQRAAKAAFDFIQRRWPHLQHIAVFCGGGNNGGDGYVLAHLAHERDIKVKVWQVGDHQQLQGEARIAYELCQSTGVAIERFDPKVDLEHPELVIDAICGIGLRGSLREESLLAIERMQRSYAPILAIDIPSGVDADTGHVEGKAVFAAATITFIGLKIGLLTGQGIAHTGELILNDLQLPPELFSLVKPIAERAQLSPYVGFLKPRLRDWHKGLSGHVLVVGGDFGFSGAPRMAAEACLRVGAGLVSVATHAENAIAMNTSRPEIMCHGVKKKVDIQALLNKADVVVLGPGLGLSAWSKGLWEEFTNLNIPIVLDADGLNLLALHPKVKDNWVLTPHPGEAARLLDMSIAEIQKDRLGACKAIQQRYGGVCVLKGAGSFIWGEKGLPNLCDKGNPGMASAGMGDILSGVIGGLIAQGIPMLDAAKMGVCIHGMAGDLAAKEGERGMLAMDLMPYLRRLVN